MRRPFVRILLALALAAGLGGARQAFAQVAYVIGLVPVVISFTFNVAPPTAIYLCPPTSTSCNSTNGTDITSTTNPGPTVVVVGQAIVLSAVPQLPSGVTVVSQSWSVPGSTVGGFNAAAPQQGPVQANFSGSSTTFYWFNIGGQPSVNYSVGYSASFSDGSSVFVTADFTVEGPTNVQMSNTIGHPGVVQLPGPPQFYALGLGGLPSGYGITFQAAITPPAHFAGNFVWAQIIPTITITWTPAGGESVPCQAQNALDYEFPYAPTVVPPDPTIRVDSPYVRLAVSGLSVESYAMSSQMYVMWQPILPPGAPSMPVPIGKIPWQWGDTMDYSAGAGPPPWIFEEGAGYAQPSPLVFQPGTGLLADFPTWGPVFNAATSCPNPPPGSY